MIDIKINDNGVVMRLRKMTDKFENINPVLENIKERLLFSVEQNFLEGGRYSAAGSIMGGSRRWAALSKVTKRLRAKRGHWPGQILVDNAFLKQSISVEISGDNVIAGTNKKYAAIQQFGGMAGRGRKVKIPARPYLVFQDADIAAIEEMIAKHLSED